MKTETSKATTATKVTTADVQESLFNAANFKDFLLRNEQNMLAQTLPEYLALQLKQKHLKRADVVRGSHLDRTYVYQIFSGKKAPSRDNCWRLLLVCNFLTRRSFALPHVNRGGRGRAQGRDDEC